VTQQERRTAALDRLLKSDIGRTDRPEAECPDAEVLAALYDGSLTPRERSDCEQHLAACARCQNVLALVARSDTGNDRLKQPVWGLRALLPLAASGVAVVLVAWIATWPALQPSPEPPPRTARLEAPAEQREEFRQTQPEALPEKADQIVQPDEQVLGDAAGARKRSNTVIVPQREAKDEISERPGGRGAGNGGGVGRDLEQQRAAETAPIVEPQNESNAAASLPAAPPPPPAQSPPYRMAKRTESADAKPSFRAEESAVGQTRAARADDSAEMDKLTVAESVRRLDQIPSPDPLIAWRIDADGSVSKTIDAGKSWIVQLPAPGAVLVAGSAPSRLVAWAAGRGGTLWQTVDGTRWQKIGSPTSEDLVSVAAQDERRATVATADGTQYRTADGGRTWTRIK
jgi:hypothetical protein